MLRSPDKSQPLSKSRARRIWLRAQRLDEYAPFGDGPDATRAAVEHLGYVQIDTINVIERCHHHILFARIPGYQRDHLRQAQSVDKTVFEYWTHALSYLPTRDMRFYLGAMKREWQRRSTWFPAVTKEDVRKVLARIRKHGALTIRDIDDDVLVEKNHLWASRKPSKRALQLAFYQGVVTVSQRTGMLKTYELTGRHFGWESPPKPATDREVLDYLLDRALRSQGNCEPGFGLLSGGSAQAGHEAADRGADAPQGAGARRSRRGGQVAALGATRGARRYPRCRRRRSSISCRPSTR